MQGTFMLSLDDPEARDRFILHRIIFATFFGLDPRFGAHQQFVLSIALLNDQPLALTPVEFDILVSLAKARGRVKTREALLDEARERARRFEITATGPMFGASMRWPHGAMPGAATLP